MTISTGNRPKGLMHKGLMVGMSATDTISSAEGPVKTRQRAAKPPRLKLPKPARRKPPKPKGSAVLASLAKLLGHT